MNHLSLFLFTAMILGTSMTQAQTSFTIATKVFAPTRGGFVIETGLNLGKNRFSASISSLDVPEFFNTQSDLFAVNRSTLDLTYTRFGNGQQRGFHYGVSIGYVFDERVSWLGRNFAVGKIYWHTGARLGYVWQPFHKQNNFLKGLFFEPAFNIGFALDEKDVVLNPGRVDEASFYASTLTVSGPLLLIGYKFGRNRI